MGRTKQTVIEKGRKEYLKKVEQLKELLKDKEISKLLDFENTKLYIADEYGINGYIGIPIREGAEEGAEFELEELIYHTSAENKLKLYTQEIFDNEILLKNTTIQKNITKDVTSSLLKEHFESQQFNVKESIYLYDKRCINCKFNKLSHIHPDLGEIRVCDIKNGTITERMVIFGEDESYCSIKNCYDWEVAAIKGGI